MHPLGRLAVAGLVVVSVGLAGATADPHIDNQTEISLGTGITIFGLAFGAWAAVLGWVMFVVRREFGELREAFHSESERRRQADDRAHADRLHLERRLTDLEATLRYSSHEHGRP